MLVQAYLILSSRLQLHFLPARWALMASVLQLSRALVLDLACNPFAVPSVIIIRRARKTAIPLNTEGASVKIRSVKITRFYRGKSALCRLCAEPILRIAFLRDWG
jgi:hypothetical protein